MKFVVKLMILLLLTQSLLMAAPMKVNATIITGEQITGTFETEETEKVYWLEARPLYAYIFNDEGGLRLKMEILTQDGEMLFSSEERSDDQWLEAGASHWDCMDGGGYVIRITPSLEGSTGDFAFTVSESPGWFAATSLTRINSIQGNLDYPGDIDYYVFNRTEEERVYEIEVECDSTVQLFWVDSNSGMPEALIEGTELSLVENYPGGDIAEGDSYYGISGPECTYRVESAEDEDGGMSTWMIIGIVGGVVVIAGGIYIANKAEEGCDSCTSFDNLFGIGDIGSGCGGGE